MSLAEQLQAFMAEVSGQMPEYPGVMDKAVSELRAEFAKRPPLREGDAAPSFSLPAADGSTYDLQRQLAEGPVILNFYRGSWCPYCNLELRAYQAILPEIRKAGASLAAISPQSPDDSLSTQEKEALEFDVLSDAGSLVAERFGIAFELGGVLREFHEKGGHELPKFNAAKDWRLPLPATYVIGSDGRIKLANVDVDYRNRMEPTDVLAALATA